MKPLWEPRIAHVWWTNYLLSHDSADDIVRDTQRLGKLRYLKASRAERRKKEALYANLLTAMRQCGHAISTEWIPDQLTYRHYVDRPLLGIGGALIHHSRLDVANELVVHHDVQRFHDTIAQGRGIVIVSTHFGASGATSAYHSRFGVQTLTIRDRRFEKFVGTRHGKHYFAGLDVAFVDNEPTSSVRALRRGISMLRAGGTLNYLCDARYGTRESKATLFGRPVTFKVGPLGAARLAGAPVLPVFSWFKDGQIHAQYHEPLEIQTEQEEETFGARFAPLFEQAILRSPESLTWGNFDQQTFG